MEKILAISLLAVFIAFILPRLLGPSAAQVAQAREIATSPDAMILDVRTPAEYASGHIDNAVNIPVQQLPQRLHELGDLHAPIIIYCRSGARSAQASSILKAAGYDNLHDIGPMSAWSR
jgi:phage shock protein E